MRGILSAAVLLLCLSATAQEPGYSALLPGTLHIGRGRSFASLVEIESSRTTADRRTVAVLTPVSLVEGNPAPPVTPAVTALATQAGPSPAPSTNTSPAPSTNTSPAPSTNTSTNQSPNATTARTVPPVPLDQLCSALLSSAQDNNLPVPFFANLIWQESRLRDNAVSPKGALGIAQFMPKVAEASGLQNPFDPQQALAASARMLRALRDQFGNLGFVAAAYNAGAKRVSEWLQHGRTLPRETRGYVMDITGRSVDQWQKAPSDGDDLHFVRRLPCRDQPAFAQLEEAQHQAELQREANAVEAKSQVAKPQQAKAAEKLKVAERPAAAVHLKAQARAEEAKAREAKPVEKLRIAERPAPAARLKVQARVEEPKAREAKPVERLKVAQLAVPVARLKRTGAAEREHPRPAHEHEKVRIAERSRPSHEAKLHVHHATRERRKRV